MGFNPSPGAGISKHTLLTDKEVDGTIDHALISVHDRQVYDIESWRRLLNSENYKAGYIPKKSWSDPYINSIEALVTDYRFVYAGGRGISKIDPITMTEINFGYPPIGEYLAFDGTWIYGVSRFDGDVYKIDRDTMLIIGLPWSTANNICSIIYANGFLYVSVEVPGYFVQIYKINPVTMTTVPGGIWFTASAYEPYGLTYDGTYLYIGISSAIGNYSAIYKINPNTMTTVGVPWSISGVISATIRSLITDGSCIYAGLDNYSYPCVYKINPISMTTVLSWDAGESAAYAWSLLYDGKHICVGLDESDAGGGAIVKLDRNTMTKVCQWTNLGAFMLHALTFDGLFIYAGFNERPNGGVFRKIMKDIDESE